MFKHLSFIPHSLMNGTFTNRFLLKVEPRHLKAFYALTMVFAMLLFVMNNSLVKLTSERLPTSEVMTIRSFFSVIFALALCLSKGLLQELKSFHQKKLACLCISTDSIVVFAAINGYAVMALADVTAITMLAPFFILLLSIPILGEKVGWRHSLALVAGFIGMLCVVKPTGTSFGSGAFYALLSAIMIAVRDVLSKKLSKTIHSLVILFYSMLFMVVFGIVYSFFQVWVMPTPEEILFLCFAGIAGCLGTYCTFVAVRGATDVTFVSSFRYSIIIWAVLIGFLVWGDLPDIWAFIGIIIITFSGLYTFFADKQMTKKQYS